MINYLVIRAKQLAVCVLEEGGGRVKMAIKYAIVDDQISLALKHSW